MTIDVPINDMSHSLLGHNQLTTIDHSDLSAQLGLSLGGGAKSPDQPLSTTPSPAGSLQDEDMEDFRQVSASVISVMIVAHFLSFSILQAIPISVTENHAGRLLLSLCDDHTAPPQLDGFHPALFCSSNCGEEGWR